MSSIVRKSHGFTLVELLIVIAVVAILTAIALPLYQQQVRKSARQQAKAVLMQVAQLEERYYTANNTYNADIGALLTGTSAATVYAGGSNYLDATGKHKITLAVGSGTGGCTTITCGYRLTADLNGTYADPQCLSLTLNSTGVRGFTGSGNAKECW